MLADIVGTNSTAALTFADALAAQHTLRSTSASTPTSRRPGSSRSMASTLASYSRAAATAPAPAADTAGEPDIRGRVSPAGACTSHDRFFLDGRHSSEPSSSSPTRANSWTRLGRFADRSSPSTLFGLFWIALRPRADGAARLIYTPIARLIDVAHGSSGQPPVRRARDRGRCRRDRRAGRSSSTRCSPRSSGATSSCGSAARGARARSCHGTDRRSCAQANQELVARP